MTVSYRILQNCIQTTECIVHTVINDVQTTGTCQKSKSLFQGAVFLQPPRLFPVITVQGVDVQTMEYALHTCANEVQTIGTTSPGSKFNVGNWIYTVLGLTLGRI